MSAPITPASARLKRAVRHAVARCGGVDGAGVTAQRSRSVAGDWNNLNAPVFPPLDCALALDEVCVAMGQRPDITFALASELGFALIPLPEARHSEAELGLLLLDVVSEVGQLADRCRAALADGRVDGVEPAQIEAEASELMARVALIREYARARQVAQQGVTVATLKVSR
jgi:hypothetical protein